MDTPPGLQAGYAVAFARFRIGTWIGRPRATETRFLDRFRQRRVSSHAVGDRLDGRLGVDRDHARLDRGRSRAARPSPGRAARRSASRGSTSTQPTVSFCITRARSRPTGTCPVATSSPYCSRASASVRPTRGDLGVGVDRARHGAVVDDRVVARRVLGRDLALAEARCARAASSRRSRRRRRCATSSCGGASSGSDALCACRTRRRSARGRGLSTVRAAAGGDEHQVALDRLALAEVDGRGRQPIRSTLRALLARDWSRDPALAELLRELLRARRRPRPGSAVGSISMIVTSEPKRRKIDANSQPMMPPPRTTSRFGTSVCASRARRVDAAGGVEAVDRRPERERAGRDDRLT